MTSPTWSNRLAVSYTDGTNTYDITPIDSFQPTFALPVEVVHSLERTHAAIVRQPRSITFTFTARALGDVVARLTRLAINGTEFNITMQEVGATQQWAFRSIVLSRCIITNCQPTNATVNGPPVATFSGVSLGAAPDDGLGDPTPTLP